MRPYTGVHTVARIRHFTNMFPELAAHVVVFGKDSLAVQGFYTSAKSSPVCIWLTPEAFGMVLVKRNFMHGLHTGELRNIHDQQERYILMTSAADEGPFVIREMATPVEPQDLRIVDNLRCTTVQSMWADTLPQFAAGRLSYQDCIVDFVRKQIRDALEILPDITADEYNYALDCSSFDHYYGYSDDASVRRFGAERERRINSGLIVTRLAKLHAKFFVVPQPLRG